MKESGIFSRFAHGSYSKNVRVVQAGIKEGVRKKQEKCKNEFRDKGGG